MWLEDAIGYIAPEFAMRRTMARVALNQMRAYEGGKNGRRTSGWKTTGNSANAEAISLPTLRNRSRDLVQNNGYATAWLDQWVSNTIGTGITAKWSDDTAQALWDDWCKVADADWCLDFGGLQALAGRCIQESGEALIRLRIRRPEDGLAVPLQIQVLEPDYIDLLKTEDLASGGYIIQGVEFSAIGKPVAYWLFDRHPGEVAQLYRNFLSKRIPAEDILLVFDKKRAGQVHGIPRLAPVLIKLRDLDDYEDAELMRKKIEACFTAFITSADPTKTLGQQDGGSPADGARRNKMAPGQMEYLKPGESVEFGNPSPSGDGDFVRRQQRLIAAVGGVTYEMLTGDLSQVNYSSARVGLLNVRAAAEQWQWLVFIPGMLNRIAARWAVIAKLTGKLKTIPTVEWTCPRWQWVDPVKDAKGELLEIAGGLKSWSEGVRRRGYDPMKVLAEIKLERDKFAEMGITLTFDTQTINEAPPPSGASA